MTKVYDPKTQCRGKRKYERIKFARHGLANARRREPREAHRMTVYLCPHCNFYHVGRKPGDTKGKR